MIDDQEKNTVFLKPLVTSPKIEVGEFSYYNDADDPTLFETRNVQYTAGPEKLIIGKFCAIAGGAEFLLSSANHPMMGSTTFPFFIFGGTWLEMTAEFLPRIHSRGNTVIGNDVWIGREAVVMPGVTIGDGAIIGIVRRLGVAVQNVHAYVVGEHGDSEVPLWSSATIGGVPLSQWKNADLPPLDTTAKADIFRRVVSGGREVIAGKGFTNYVVSLATARITESVLYDEHQVLPVSSLIDDFIGINDVCLSVPSVVNRNGVQRILPVPLTSYEAEALQRSADAVRAVIQRCACENSFGPG